MKKCLVFLAPLALAGCVTTSAAGSAGGPVYARLGQRVTLDGLRVTPLALLQDSRCPQAVQCVWAGRVRISARVATRGESAVRELTLGTAVPVGGGNLTLAEVRPSKRKATPLAPRNYTFGFWFSRRR